MAELPTTPVERTAVISAPAGQWLDDDHIDAVLRRLAEAADVLIGQHEEAVRHWETLLDEGERHVEQQAEERSGRAVGRHESCTLDPLNSLRQEHECLARQRARALQASMMLFVTWWVDVAASALTSALGGAAQLTVGQVAAGNPWGVMDDSDAWHHRLWGEIWTEHDMPDLPPTFVLRRELSRLAAPEKTATALFDACFAVDHVLAVTLHLEVLEKELTDADEAGDAVLAARIDDMIMGLIEVKGELPGVLAAYARTVAEQLPAVRTAARAGVLPLEGKV